jgi:hypothetical protein
MLPGLTLSLSISQQNARLGFDIKPGKLEMVQKPADLQIVQKPAVMDIDAGPGQLSIDGSAARAALGHKTTLEMVTNIAQQARQVALDVIGQIAAEGDQLAQIEKGTTVIDIIQQHMDMGPMPIEDSGPFSNHNVDVTYTPHPTKISWTVNLPQISVTPNLPQINYTPGSVAIYLQQRNGVQIDVKGKYLNMEF